MGINAGCAWTKTSDDKKTTTISGFFSDELLELIPQLKNFRFILRHVPAEERKSEKSPHWRMDYYIPSEQPQNAVEDEEIPI